MARALAITLAPAGRPQGAARDGVSLGIASLTIFLIAVTRPMPEDKSRNRVPFINQSSTNHQPFKPPWNGPARPIVKGGCNHP